jgi:hypothetical protein
MSNSEFTIDIIANDEASAVISNVQVQLNGVAGAAGTTTGAMTSLGTATAATNVSFVSSMGTITQVTAGFGQAAYSVIAVETAHATLDRTLRMVDMDTITITKDTAAYNDAVAKYGPNSSQAAAALQTLDIAQMKLSDDTERATAEQQSYDMALVQLATFTIPMLLTSLAKLPAAYDAVGNIGAKLGLGDTAAAADTAGTSLGTTGAAVTSVGAASSGAAAGLAAVGAGAAAVAAEGEGAVTVLSNLNDKIKAGTVSTTDLASALLSVATPVQLMSQGVDDFLTKLGLLPTQAGTVSDQTIASFQNLYDKLVGGSIWPDTWNAMQTIATTSTATITNLLQTNLTDWTLRFTNGTKGLSDVWTPWLQTWVTTTTAGVTVVSTSFQNFFTLLNQGQLVWTNYVAASTAAMANMKAAVTVFLTWLVPYWTTAFDTMEATFNTQVTAMETLVTTDTATMRSAWQSMLDAMVSSTESALDKVYSEMQSKLDAIIAAVKAAKQQISSGSIWPDMLAEMLTQTHAGMAAIQGEFAQGFESPGGILQTIQGDANAATAPAPAAAPGSAAPGGQVITLPITVMLDGQQIQTFLEKRIVDTIYTNAGRSKRGKV